jgi:hypothetical protein
MTAHFYLMAESFNNNANFSTGEIENKVKRLAEDVKLINEHKETNKLYTNYKDIYPQIFIAKYTVFDFICSPQKLREEGVDRDIINALQNIIQKSEPTTVTSQEVKDELIDWNDEDNCHGLIAFHPVDGVDNSLQIFYGIDGWYTFRRHFLGLYPKNVNFYIDECIKYFPQLYFHQDNRDTIGSILDECPVKIVYHLAALNDKFRDSQQPGFNRTQVLVAFSANAKLDETASLEGDAARKKALTFSFTNSNNVPEDICCEPHLKLCYSDYDNSYSTDRRIYFHEGKASVESGKILIGHIGRHL